MTSVSRAAHVGFLLTRLGSDAARKFAARTKDLGITPAQAGVIRILERHPGITQRELASKLHAVQSRVVALIDSLESLDCVARVRSTSDRRSYALQLTDHGREVLVRLRTISEMHEAEVTRGLSAVQRETLAELLGLLGTSPGLDSDVHPGYAGSGTKFEPLVFAQIRRG